MRITKIEMTPFRIPLNNPFGFATGTVTAAEHVLVEVFTDDGVVGVAEAIPRPMIYGETLESVQAAIRGHIAPQVVGLGVHQRAAMLHAVRNLIGNPAAKAGVELAMFDALGKTLGVPCHTLLGGFASSVRTNFNLPGGTTSKVVETAQRIAAQHGIAAFKAKVGLNLEEDIATVLALREALPDADLVVDANHGYTADAARRFLDRTRDAQLAFVEEPSPAEERISRRRLCAASDVLIMGDESCATLRDVASEVLTGGCTMISLKLARTAITTTSQIRDFCLGTGTPVAVGSQGDTAIGSFVSAAFAAASPATLAFPAELTYYLDLEDDLCVVKPEIVDGAVKLPDRPGFGYEIDRDKLAHFRIA
jgi:L-alanine-DL-glutamate epimerase-like enolase superfamily enzyme